MTKIYIIGFRGLGTRDADYTLEDALIYTGHVGIAFEGEPKNLIGFRPTEAAIAQAGGIEQAIAKLKAHKKDDDTLEGRLYNDYAHFKRAAEIAQARSSPDDRNTTVFQYTIEITDAEFQRVYDLIKTWADNKTSFTYAFPIKSFPEGRDNCGSFMRKLGIRLDGIGDMIEYIEVLKQQRIVWTPEGTRNATERDLE